MLHSHVHFSSVFGSGFAESASDIDLRLEPASPDDASVSDAGALAQQFDDSDFEDDDMLDTDDFPIDDSDAQDAPSSTPPHEDRLPSATISTVEDSPSESNSTHSNKRASAGDDETSETHNVLGLDADDEQDEEQSGRNTRPKLSHPSTPRSKDVALEQERQVPSSPLRPVEILPVQSRPQPEMPGPKKARVVVRDVAYATYRAVLYYVRLCSLLFAPLCTRGLIVCAHRSTPTRSHSPPSPRRSSGPPRRLPDRPT